MTTFPQRHLRQLILSSYTFILIVSYSIHADGRVRLSALRKLVLTYYSYVRGTTCVFLWLAVGSCRKPNRAKAVKETRFGNVANHGGPLLALSYVILTRRNDRVREVRKRRDNGRRGDGPIRGLALFCNCLENNRFQLQNSYS